MKLLDEAAIKVLERFPFLYAHVLLRKKSPLTEWGWFRSFKTKESVDASGGPLPWLTYGCIEFLRPRVDPTMEIFEFGAGNGTLWWARHTANVLSIEHDALWYGELKRHLPANVELILADLDDGSYTSVASQLGRSFDIIVIDGRRRVECAKNAVNALKPSGVIIWDDSDREKYADGLQHLFELGFRKIEFRGFTPIEFMMHETAILYRPDNCLNI